jgi:hypothetical protein
MASNLGGTHRSGKSTWDVYVKGNPNRISVLYEITSGYPMVQFFEKTSDIPNRPSMISLKTGDKFNILGVNTFSSGQSKYANIRFNGKSGYVKITTIRKPTKRNALFAEERALSLAKENLQKCAEISGIGRGNATGIELRIPGVGTFIGITDIEKVSNKIHGRESKSDFIFKNILGKKLIHISHKDGIGPSAFSQYGGVSETSSGSFTEPSNIYNNSEVQEYLTKLYNLYDDAISGKNEIKNNPFDSSGTIKSSVYKFVQSSLLVNQSVYGPDYSGSYGPDNVNLIGQGDFIFKPYVDGEEGDIYFELQFSGGYYVNGDVSKFMNDSTGYRATFITSNRLGRPTRTPLGSIPNTRTGIYPKAYRSSAVSIDSFGI